MMDDFDKWFLNKYGKNKVYGKSIAREAWDARNEILKKIYYPWVNIKDRLPDNDKWVFVSTKETETCSAGSFYGMRRGVVWYDAGGKPAPTDGIVYWMSLPESPELSTE